MRLADIHQRQHHENERLQETRSGCGRSPTPNRNATNEPATLWAVKPPGRAQQGDQQEQQLAGKHVAEQSHTSDTVFAANSMMFRPKLKIHSHDAMPNGAAEQFVDPSRRGP
jgi:hypothetical protein